MKLLLHPKTSKQIATLLRRPPHAVGIFGGAGAGKSFIARYIAQGLLGIANAEEHPSVKLIDVASGDGIARVREIRKFLALRTTGSSDVRRVVIVENADQLSQDAQNALLKTLEEPPLDTVLLLTAAQKSHLLATILSRLQPLTIATLTKQQCLQLEGYTASQLEKAYALSGGQAGLFLALLDEGDEHETRQAVLLAKNFLANSAYTRLADSDEISKDKVKLELLIQGLELCLYAALQNASKKSMIAIHKRLEVVARSREQLERNVQAKLLYMNLAVSL